MSDSSALASALAHVRTLRASVLEGEESRDLQRRTVGSILPKTERQLLERRRLLAAALVKASRLSRDAGDEQQALLLLREFSLVDHLVEQAQLKASAGQV